MQEGVFDEVAEFVEFLIVFTLYLAVSFRRYDGLHSLIFRLRENGIGIIPFVRQQRFSVDAFNQAACLSAIRCCTLCNKSPDRQTMRIHGKMQLCVEPPFVRLMS